MSELPKGWTTSKLRDISRPNRPRRNPADYAHLPFVGMEQIEPHTRRILGTLDSATMRSTAFHFQPSDVLYGRLRPYLNKIHCSSFEGLCSSEFIVLPPSPIVEPRYLAYYLNTHAFVEFANHLNQGDRPRVSFDQIGVHAIPIPPLNEQRRIVEKLDKLLGRVEAVQARLDKIPAILKRFRQSVLAAACSGKLTTDWRAENNSLLAFPLSILRKEVLELATNGRERAGIETAFEFAMSSRANLEIPGTWTSATIGTVGLVSNGSTPSRKVATYWNGNIPWVSSGEVRNNVITETHERITTAGYENSSTRLLPIGTVLLAMIGEGKTRGQAAMLHLKATINQNIASIVPHLDHVFPSYLWYSLRSQYDANRERGSGSGPQALNCQRVREIPFSLPPIEEQKEIVRRVDDLFKFADALEERYKKAKTHTDKLTQSILAKAFRGELVPQDPNDEPASKLLERIKADTIGQ